MKFVQIAVGLLIAIAMPARPDSAVVFNEIMYHPVTNESQLEWVELQNQLAVDVDMSQWRLDGGIDYRFPEGTVIRAGGYLVIASSPATLMSATGLTNVLGPSANRLSNAGERLRLRNNDSRIIDQVTYGVEGDWPVAPDGTGPSLARRRANLSGADSKNWLASAQVGGTPGAENFPIPQPTVLSNAAVRIEDLWRFNDTGVDPGPAWKNSNYDDSGWPEGAALFFQEDGLLPATKNTPLTPGRITYYFRTCLVITGDVQRIVLNVRPVIDDGAVAYVNGVEVFRINMPAGDVNYATIANAVVGDATFGETVYIASDHFVAGTNILAVEVHQGRSFGAYSQTVIDANPLGYWRFGENLGPAVDSAGLAGAQNGSYAGFSLANRTQAGPRPTDTINGQPLSGFETNNAAPRFAGNADNGDDVVIIPDPGLFNFAGTRIFTLEAWVNGGTLQEGSAGVIAKGTGGGGEQFAIDVFNGAYRFFGWNGAGGAAVATAAIGPNGTWQHLVAVLDQSASRMKLYINGVESASTTPFATLVDTGHEVSIGSRKNSSSSNYDLNFEGRIDEVAIYNRALSPAEITAHFNAAFTNNAAAGPDTNDVVFGLEIINAETLPEPEEPKIAFNEHSSSTNAAFWLELINDGRANVDLGGWTIARFGGATNRQFTLPSQVLAPGELLQVTKDQMGFGADSGDRLALYKPGGTNVADVFVAKTEPRGRSPDGTGAWWFPNQPTPGASNSFVFRNELVINEIMFHQRELLAEPATFSPTNLLLTISNAWKYHAEGVDLGTDWRARFFNDSAWAASNAVFYAPTNPFSLPAPKNTFVPLTNSSGARIITYYFRTEFDFAGVTNGLTLALRPIIDDGAVFYLNGEEVYRQNMPATNILYGTLATVSIGIPGFTGPIAIPITNLLEGLNTLAVEVHQSSVINNDFDFGAELLAYYQVTPALPFRDSPESWVEIFNRSSNTVDLTGWRLDEGIDYRFQAGKTLAPGGYLVVAKDLAHMQALYPGLDAVGPFTNRLSHDSDYIVLKSPNNNVADEVRYFSGGRWHEYADGGGSSLELRDPRSDNLQPEAWAASDETGKAQWQTFTWRGLVAPGQTG
ncbi:MAG TPA: lamin tail domain-containing protein, partial [Candidatus Binatia bacterium]|nr:lamin tail domain-containing protein [Candidatus Binatia bacterium]